MEIKTRHRTSTGEDPKFAAWYIAEFKASYMPPFENGGYPTSKRAQMTWAAWRAAKSDDR